MSVTANADVAHTDVAHTDVAHTDVAWNRPALPPGAEQDAVVKGITGEIS